MRLNEFNPQTNEQIVIETRELKPFRALPRAILDRIVGNEAKKIKGLDTTKTFRVRYQDFVGQYVSAVRCWKCSTPIVSYQPALRKVEGTKNEGALTTVKVNGESMILGAMLPFNHYREGLFLYRTSQGVLSRFSFLHCADCTITDAHGEDLLACLLGQMDHRRDHLKLVQSVSSDDAWAQYLSRWSGIELVGREGPSRSPQDMMNKGGA